MELTPYYKDDHVTLYHGDCLDMLPHIVADVLVTDPPYGIDYRSNRRRVSLPRSIHGDKDTSARDDVLDWWGAGPAIAFGTWRIPRPEGTRQVLIWDTKGALGMGAMDLPWKPSHQEVYVLGRGFTGRRTTDVLRFAPVQSLARNGRTHPHEKPVDLLRELVGKCPDGVVLDPFAGSGSTLRAAKDLGRKAIGIEIDRDYCDVIVARLAQEVLL